MALTGTWVKDPTGALVLKWTADDAPVRHRRHPPAPGLSEGKHRD